MVIIKCNITMFLLVIFQPYLIVKQMQYEMDKYENGKTETSYG